MVFVVVFPFGCWKRSSSILSVWMDVHVLHSVSLHVSVSFLSSLTYKYKRVHTHAHPFQHHWMKLAFHLKVYVSQGDVTPPKHAITHGTLVSVMHVGLSIFKHSLSLSRCLPPPPPPPLSLYFSLSLTHTHTHCCTYQHYWVKLTFHLNISA